MMATSRPAPLALRLALPALTLPLLALGCGRGPEPAASASPSPAAVAQAAPRGAPRAGPGGDPAARRHGSARRALQGRPRRHDQAAGHPRPDRPEPGPLLRGPGAGGGDHVRVDQGVREAAQRQAGQQGREGPRGRHPRGARPAHPALLAGRGDIAAAQLTVTPGAEEAGGLLRSRSRPASARSSSPARTPRRWRASPSSRAREVYVRPSSSYAEHIAALNKRFAAEGKPPLKITPAPEILEDGDILEMVSAGPRPGHGGGRLHRRPLHAGLPEPARSTPTSRAPRRHRLGVPQEQPEAGGRRERLRQDATGRGRWPATCSSTST